MAEELQGLLDRIRKEGIEKADAQAREIVARAEEKARSVIEDAQKRAEAARAESERAAAQFEAQARRSIEQAARDVILAVGETVNTALERLVRSEVADALTGDTLRGILVQVVDAYCSGKGEGARIDVWVAAAQRQQIVDYFMSRFAQRLRSGLEIKADHGVVAGFRVSLVGDHVEHDFSAESIASALCQLLRPRLAEIVKNRAASGQ